MAGLVVAALVGTACDGGAPAADDEGGNGTEHAAGVDGSPAATTPPSTLVGQTSAGELCDDAVATTGLALPEGVTEASGVVASEAHRPVLWAHQDSGAAAEVVALDRNGSDLGRVEVAGADALDWEDIARLPGGGSSPDRLVLADVGDNPGSGSRATVPPRLVVVDEPDPPGPGGRATSAPSRTVAVAYPDGSRDAEALLADPRTGDVFVVSKQWDGSAAGIYRVPAASVADPGTTSVVMERAAAVGASTASLVTGGDVSPDGAMVALRTYTDVRLWDRSADETVPEALERPPECRIPIAEPQGEAVAFTADGRGLVTVSEGAGEPLHLRRLP